jgi:hypothetical protein
VEAVVLTKVVLLELVEQVAALMVVWLPLVQMQLLTLAEVAEVAVVMQVAGNISVATVVWELFS